MGGSSIFTHAMVLIHVFSTWPGCKCQSRVEKWGQIAYAPFWPCVTKLLGENGKKPKFGPIYSNQTMSQLDKKRHTHKFHILN